MLLNLIFHLFYLTQLVTNQVQNNGYEVAQIPAILVQNANAVIREETTSFIIKDLNNATKKVNFVVTILNDQAAKYATVVVPYDKFSKVGYLKGTLYNKDGQVIKKLKNTEIRDIGGISAGSLIADTRIKTARFTNASYPVTVEFEYEINYSGSLFYPTWHPQNDYYLAVQQANFQVITPNNQTFRYKGLNCSQPEKNYYDKAVSYNWKLTNVPAKEKEAFQPPLSELTTVVFSAPSTFEMDGFSGDMTTWKSFGLWFDKLNKDRDKLPEPTVAKLKTLTATAPDDYSKIKILYNYLQENTRYVSIQLGIGGWRPFEASFVDEKGYGDCKALSNYMRAMLRSVGINSYYSLIVSGQNEPDIQVDFPSSQFNHAVLCVPLSKDTIWLECTSQTEAMGYAGSFTGNRHALLITPDGGKLVKTPSYSGSENTVSRKAEVLLNADGNATATLETIFSGLEQDEPSFVVSAGSEDQQAWFRQNVQLANYSVKNLEYSRQKDRLPKVTEKATLVINKCVGITSKRFFLTPNLFSQNTIRLPENKNRTVDILQNQASIATDIITFHLPPGVFHPEFFPETQNIKSSFGEYSVTYKIAENKITYNRTLKLEKGRYAANQYNELQEFFRKVTAADKTQIVLVSKS